MATTTIEIEPPLSDRPLKYGRNVMAVSSIILVLASVPGIDVGKFSPFGLSLPPGNEIYIWGILIVVQIYYAFQFYVGGFIDFRVWYHSHSPIFRDSLEERSTTDTDLISETHQVVNKTSNQRVRVFLRFLILDVVIPTVLFSGGVLAATAEIRALP